MPDLAKEVKITINDDGKFKLESDNGNVSNYNETELILVLEEVVKQFRGDAIKITNVTKGGEEIKPVSPSPPQSNKPIINADNIGEHYHNGGIGPRIQPGDADAGLGYGVTT